MATLSHPTAFGVRGIRRLPVLLDRRERENSSDAVVKGRRDG